MSSTYFCVLYPDIDECSTGVNSCSQNAHCTNKNGSYACECDSGFFGNGILCEGYLR